VRALSDALKAALEAALEAAALPAMAGIVERKGRT